MAATRKTKECRMQDIPRGSFLAHVEHLKNVGEALTRASETFIAKQDASEKEDRWLKDLPFNILEASKDLHTSLMESPHKTSNVYSSVVKGEGV